MRKLIALLSVLILSVGLMLTVSPGPYGTTENDVGYNIESPVYSPILSYEVGMENFNATLGVSTLFTIDFLLIEEDLDPDTQGMLVNSEVTHDTFVSVVRLSLYKQARLYDIYTKHSDYG